MRRRQADDLEPRRSRGFFAGLVSATLTLAALGLVAALAAMWIYHAPGPAARDGEETTVILRRGAGLSEIGAALEGAGVTRSATLFMAAAQVNGAARSLKAGEYAFASGSSLADVLDQIQRGEVVHHRVTIAEGLTSQQAVDILARNPILTGSAPTPAEGALLPETYDIVRGEERSAVLQRMMDAQEKLLAELWATRQPGLPFETPQQAVTLASIVEKETGVPSERPRVAAVYVNRLRQGIRLEADPTVVYGISRGMPLGRGLRVSELENAGNPYNTYRNAGLPPTPIANAGRASLAAVLDPPTTNEIFFVADGTGGHAFAETYDEHLRNVARWRQIERSRPAAAAPPTGTGTAAPAVEPEQ
jgi:UPF0755 protein